jgi:hypothetical protein
LTKITSEKTDEDHIFECECYDPLSLLGFGIHSYFVLLTRLFYLFSLLTIAHIPLAFNYASMQTELEHPGGLTGLSLASLGQAETKCAQQRQDDELFIIDCNHGVVTDIVSIGVFKVGSDAFTANVCNSDIFAAYDNGRNDCYGVSERDGALFKYVENTCVGNKRCFPSEADINLLSNRPNTCAIDPDSRLFIQYTCKETPKVLE